MSQMKAKLCIIVGSLFLSGCMKYVYIPVATCPPPPVVVEKPLQVPLLLPSASVEDKLKALTVDYVYLRELKEQYRVLLMGYGEPIIVIK